MRWKYCARYKTRIFDVCQVNIQDVQGNYTAINGQEVCIFAENKNLYLQWNARRWNFRDIAGKLKYEHDFHRNMTTFSVGDLAINYIAWWANDPTFEPGLVGRDEDEDIFAYVARLASDNQLQQMLTQSRDK